MKIIILFLLIAPVCYCQNGYENAKLLSEVRAQQLKLDIITLRQKEGYDTSSNKAEIENFYNFLIDPFNQNLATVNVDQAISSIVATRVELEIAEAIKKGFKLDSDGDNVPDYLDACPDVMGTIFNKGCPETTEKQAQKAVIPSGQDMTTVLVDALAKFLVDRVNQELTITFFDNFRERLNDKLSITFTLEEKNITLVVELKQVFPNTFLLLDSKDYFDTPSLGKTWVTAFKKDLINLPSHLEIVIRSNPELLGTNIGSFTLMSFDIILHAKRGDHPIRIIEYINNKYNSVKSYRSEAQQVIGMLYLISSNLTHEVIQGGEKVISWVTPEELQKLDKSSKKYLAGLLYQQGRQSTLFNNIQINNETLTKKITLSNYNAFYDNIFQISSRLKNVVQLLDKVKSDVTAQPTDKTLEEYTSYLTAFYSLLDENMKMVYHLFDDQTFYTSTYFTKVRPIATDIIGFHSAFSQQNYAETILLSVSLLRHICNGDNNNEIIKTFTYYSNFLADIIAASESGKSEDVKKIIENYAMPVGSYRIKRMYSHSWDVNAFPGIYLGYETSDSNSLAYGITSPIGIAYSRKHTRKEKTSSSSTFFLSVIDIGAPFSYRFNNDEADGLPEAIKWEQIFSPGLFYMYGFNKTPITLSLGGQFTPLLRKIKDENNVLDEKNVFRISLALTVDICIFNLKKGKLH